VQVVGVSPGGYWPVARATGSWKLKAGYFKDQIEMRIFLRVWRQAGPKAAGAFVDYTAEQVSTDMSFLEMLDVVNEGLIKKGEDPIAFDSDCREGICGTCGFLISGIAHGPESGTTVCQLHMRRFKDGDRLVLEPWRAQAFPVVKDLVVDRSALDRIIQAGGYTSINTGGAQDGNAILIPKTVADKAMDSAACIGCGACVAACKNASAALFTSAKVSQLALLPQGQVERARRVVSMVDRHDSEGFGSCSNEGECEAVCPKEIPITNIARMNREYFRAMLLNRD
jgi:succinate dehydrogenase / fumarate reductase, iron-sulfur subunit